MAQGKKTGGRTKGTPNKRTTELYTKLEEGGEMPLAYLLRRMREDKGEEGRIALQCAIAAAPYCHPRLASTEVSGKDGGPIETNVNTRDLARAVIDVLRQAQVKET